MCRSCLISTFLLILFSDCLQAGTIDPNTPDHKYIDYATKFDYIVQIIGMKDDDSSFSGSGVAFKKNVIITAAHLFNKCKTSAILYGNSMLPIKKVIVHKDYAYDKFGKHDIAICLIGGDFGLEWYPSVYTSDRESGAMCSLAGYGGTGTFSTGVIADRGCAKRAGSNRIDSADQYLLYCSPSISLLRTELEFLIALGDSGGGLFIGNELAGIHSGIIEDKQNKGQSKYGAVSIHTRVSLYKDWIQDTTIELLQDE